MRKIYTLPLLLLLLSSNSNGQMSSCSGSINLAEISTSSGSMTRIGEGKPGTRILVILESNSIGNNKCSGDQESLKIFNNDQIYVGAFSDKTKIGSDYSLNSRDGYAKLVRSCPESNSGAVIKWTTIDVLGNNICNHIIANQSRARSGTYQIIRKSKVQELITNEYMDKLLIDIETKRDDFEEKRVKISDLTEIRILPRSVINKNDFQPLTEEFVYEK